MKRKPRVTKCAALPEGVLLYTKAQMAAAMQVSVRWLNKLMRGGSVSYLKLRGKLVRFRPEDVLRQLNETSLVCKGTSVNGAPAASEKGRMGQKGQMAKRQ